MLILHTYVASAVMSMHYGTVIGRCGSVGIAVATSSISRGKTNCAKLAVAMCGNYPKGCAGYLTDSMARGYLSGGLPFVYDDPSNDAVLKPLLINSFGGSEIGTRRLQFAARCTPIVTCNEFVLESLARADDRYSFVLSVILTLAATQNTHTGIWLGQFLSPLSLKHHLSNWTRLMPCFPVLML